MMEEIIGQIDISTCAEVIANSYQQYMLPLGIALAVMMVGFLIFAVLFMQSNRDEKLARDFLRRKKLLNDFEDWKKDRELKL